jgi:hypothetical protein
MSGADFMQITLIGTTGRRWTISGPGQGAQGCELMPKPKQFYDSPAETYWIKSGGAKQKYQGYSFKRRDPLFGLVISGDDPEDDLYIADQVRTDLGMYDDTFMLEAKTRYGTRRLEMRLLEDPKAFESGDWEGKAPGLTQANTIMVSAACEQPHWAADPVTSAWEVTAGGNASTNEFQHPGNPGDVPIFPRWTLNAPAEEWEIPDPSLGQELDFQRQPGQDTALTYKVVALLAGEDVELNTNPDEPFMITIAGGFGPWMRSGGRELIYPVKARTKPFETTVRVTGAAAGATATLELDRWYSRPFGATI